MLAGTLTIRDVDNLETNLRKTLNHWLQSHGGTLDHHDYEDCLTTLIAQAWYVGRPGGHYNPTLNSSFSHYIHEQAPRWIITWYRKRKGSSRNKHKPELLSYDTLPGELADGGWEEELLSEMAIRT